MDEAAKKRVLAAGAAAYAQALKRAPPASQADLEAELDDLPTEIRNAITAALWSHSYDVFVEAVRRALVKSV
jgi:hypothetical protein